MSRFRPEIYDTPEEREEADRFTAWEEDEAEAKRERWLEEREERFTAFEEEAAEAKRERWLEEREERERSMIALNPDPDQ